MASASVALAPPPPTHTQSTPNIHSRSHFDDSPRDRMEISGNDKSVSPESTRTPPKVVVKKEPSSPEPPRHRPSKLNLISGSSGTGNIISQTPRTAKGSLSMQDLGMACLSPGLNVTDNAMREQLERSMNVRNAQRNIIESRLHRNVHSKDDSAQPTGGLPTGKGKKRPPSGLSIVPPHHTAFANERIIQSAPLNQSFTVRRQAMLEARQERNANRLPPIADVVFRQDRDDERSQLSAQRPQETRAFFPNPLPSPRLAPPEHQQQPERPREYKSAEEAVARLSGGREDLLPRIVHYGGHQPPTPPSPTMAQKAASGLSSSSHKTKTTTLTIPVAPSDMPNNKRRRTNEFETDRDVSMGSDSEEQDAAEAKRRKKELFLSLMAQAFDVLHS